VAIEYDLYNVGSLDEIIGNENQVSRLREFARDINKGNKKMPLLIFGPSGVGKTAAAHLIAKENGWNVVELNASDYRDKETIETRLISAATSKSLFGAKNLILLDEIDEMAARFDKGAGAAIGNLINQTKNPIIFIANDMWDQSITFLRGKTDPIEFKRIMPDTTKRILGRLVDKFSLSANKMAIEMICNRANGDARSAINDLSVIIGSPDDDEITEVLGLRDKKIDVFNVLDKVFLSSTISAAQRAVTNTDLTNDMLIKWIDENIPKRYRYSEEMKAAFESLAYASMFATRAQRSQYYTYWRYMNVLMSAGVALAKTRYPDSRGGYSFPKVIKELSTTKGTRNQDKIIAAKLQRVFHSSIKRIIRNEMKVLSRNIAKQLKENKDSEQEIMDYLMSTYQLDEKEINYMLEHNS
jgi:replication factor C large subunit